MRLFLLGVILVPFASGGILVPPHSINATLNSTVNFTCISNGSHMDWFVDNQPEEMNEIDVTRKIGPSIEKTVNTTEFGEVLKSTIPVAATLVPDNNGTEVRCRVHNFPASMPAILLVQGTLGPVIDLNVDIGNETVVVKWIKPYSLHGVPILGFNMMLTEDPESTVVFDNFYDNSTTHIEVDPFLVMCRAYKVKVWASNEVGKGTEANLTWFNPGVLSSVTEHDVSAEVTVNDTNFIVSITVKTYVACLEQTPYQASVHLLLMNVGEGDSNFNKAKQNISQQMDSKALLFVIGDLLPRQHYSVDISLCNIAGCNMSNEVASFSTFDTQQVMFGAASDIFCFMCTFLVNSSSSACGISLNGNIRAKTALRVYSTDYSEWSCLQNVLISSVVGTVVNLFDVSDNGDIAQSPAIIKTITSNDEFIQVTFETTPSMASSTVTPSVTGLGDETNNALIVVISVVVTLLLFIALVACIVLTVVYQRHLYGHRTTPEPELTISTTKNQLYGVTVSTLSAQEKGDMKVIKACEPFPLEQVHVSPYYDTIPVPSTDRGKHPDSLYETVSAKSNGHKFDPKHVEDLPSKLQQQDIELTSTTECPAYRCTSIAGNYYKGSVDKKP